MENINKSKIPDSKPKVKKATKPKVTSKQSIKKPARNFPTITIEESLKIAHKIKELNGGNAWSPKEVSKAIQIGNTNSFYYYSAASRDYGITLGTRDTKEISLTDFGRSVVYAPNPEIERQKKIEAFLNISIFKDVLNYYKGSNLPEMKYLGNTLEDKFKLHPDYHDEFSKVFNENCKDLKINSGDPLQNEPNNVKSPASIVVGETKRTNKGKLKAFVIMPFVERDNKRSAGFFNEVLNSLIIPSGIDAEFTVETANKQGSDVIQSTIINDLLEADLVIADLTDHNPNVLFELGLRMAADLPIALIKSKDTGRIFDVDNMLRVYEYDQNLWKTTVEADLPLLTAHFKAAWDNRNSEQSYMKILRRVASNGQTSK
jgi:hypothetical protein